MPSRRIAQALAVAVLATAGCVYEPPAPAFDSTPRVQVVAVEAPPTALERTLLSTAEPARDAVLSPMRPGRVVRRAAEPGTVVQAGAAILVLDSGEATANLALADAAVLEADAVVAEAQRQQGRVGALGDGASEAQRDTAATALARADASRAAALAQRELASVYLAHLTVRAPFDGEVAWLEPEVGESVPAGAPVARVVDATSLRVVVGLLEDEVVVARDGAATFGVRSGAVTVPASLVHVAPAASPVSRDWSAELRVDGAPFPLGAPVEVHLVLPSASDAGLLPPRAVVDGAVWRFDEGTVSRVPVEVVAEHRDGLLVRGVSVGDRVVLYGGAELEDGAAVVLLEAP
jgi:multidrug efflux system membrane fusion protein